MPATTTGVLVVLVTDTSGQLIVMLTGPDMLLPALVSTAALTLAVFEIEPQLCAVVVAVSVTFRVAPCATEPKPHVRTPLLIEHAPASDPPTVQLSPAGRESVSTTLFEAPGPPAVTLIA
jgi:hypothetical protein